jgi:2-polyprenyl-3-methyl-5-hydroxy-6-metoxy-1,4-benzoquinol methylase
MMQLSPEQLRAIAAKSLTRWDSHYVPMKLRSDPVYSAVAEQMRGSSLPILDIGCGLGLLTHWLRAAGHVVPMTGFDYDERKIRSAQAMASGMQDVSFTVGDARSSLPEHCGHVVILDILQFFTLPEQDALLAAAASRVAPGGALILRSGLSGRNWRFRVTLAGDWLAKLTFWMKAAPVCYPSAEQFQRVLSASGLTVEISPLWGRTPFNNHLIVARRPA